MPRGARWCPDSQAAVDEEVARNEYARQFRPALPKAFSIHAVAPPREVRIFEVGGNHPVNLAFDMPRKLGDSRVLYHGVDENDELTFTVTERGVRPRWLRADALDTYEYACHILTTVNTAIGTKLIFVLSTTEALHDRLLQLAGATDAPRLAPEDVNQLLHALKPLSASSVGLRAGSSGWGRRAEYKTLAGSKVNNAVRGTDAHGYNFGHMMALHDNGGRFETVGASTGKAKIWKPGNVSLFEFRQWCVQLAGLLDQDAAGSQAPLFDVHVPSRASRFPEHPLAISLPPEILQSDMTIEVAGGQTRPVMSLTFSLSRATDALCRVEVTDGGAHVINYDVDLRGRFSSADDVPVSVPGIDTPVVLSEVLSAAPVGLLFANGATVSQGAVFHPPARLPAVPGNMLTAWDWTGVDITKETEPAAGLESIHAATERKLGAQTDADWILNDDRAYELADVVTIALDAETGNALVDLVHCKFSSTAAPGRDISNLYEVVGQAVRSGKWSAGPARVFIEDVARRIRHRAATRVIRGDQDNLLQLLDHWAIETPPLHLTVTIVQPGLDVAQVDSASDVRAMLVAAHDWLDRMGASMRVVGSR